MFNKDSRDGIEDPESSEGSVTAKALNTDTPLILRQSGSKLRFSFEEILPHSVFMVFFILFLSLFSHNLLLLLSCCQWNDLTFTFLFVFVLILNQLFFFFLLPLLFLLLDSLLI